MLFRRIGGKRRSGMVRLFVMIALQILHGNAEKLRYLVKAHLVRSAFSPLPRRPLLRRDAEGFGTAFAAAVSGVVLQAAGPDVPGDGCFLRIGDFFHRGIHLLWVSAYLSGAGLRRCRVDTCRCAVLPSWGTFLNARIVSPVIMVYSSDLGWREADIGASCTAVALCDSGVVVFYRHKAMLVFCMGNVSWL